MTVDRKKRTRIGPRRSSASESSGSGNRPAERWTEILLDQGFVPVARRFLRNYSKLDPPLTPGEALFVIHLMDFKRDSNAPYPSYGRVAGYMGISDKMVRIHAQRLERKGYLHREQSFGKTNRFNLAALFSAVEKLIHTTRDSIDSGSRIAKRREA